MDAASGRGVWRDVGEVAANVHSFKSQHLGPILQSSIPAEIFLAIF
jgi:hypothetical protein